MKNISMKKIGLFIKNNYIINRSVPIILFIVVLVLGSIIGAMPVSDVEMRYDNYYHFASDLDRYESYRYSMDGVYEDLLGKDGVFSLVFIVVALIIAFLSTLSSNAFMREKSASDFYHAISVNRAEIYIANYITAFINSAVTIVVSQLAGLFFMNLLSDYHPLTFFEALAGQVPTILTTLLFLALFIAISMIATLGAGTVFAAIINFLVLNFYIPATVLALAISGSQLFSSNLMDYLDHHPDIYCYSSPFIRYIYSAIGYFEMSFVSYLLYILATVAIIALGVFFYKKKKNENFSKPLPFSIVTRPMQYLLTFDAILLGATFFEAITSSPMWCFIGALLTLFFAFIIFNAFADKSFNGVFKRSRHMVFIAIFTIVVGFIFSADAFGLYKNPEPDVDKITEAYISVNIQYEDRNEYYYFDFTTDEEEANEWTTKIKDEDVEVIKNLYVLTRDYSEKYNYRYTDEVGKIYMSVSMGISCENDFARYHNYSTISNSEEEFQDIYALVNYLLSEYNYDSDVYYHEKTEVEYVK